MIILDEKLQPSKEGGKKRNWVNQFLQGLSVTLLYPDITSLNMQILRKSNWPSLTLRPTSGPEKVRASWMAFHKFIDTEGWVVSQSKIEMLSQAEGMKVQEAKT